jgi:chromosome segregation ATPase
MDSLHKEGQCVAAKKKELEKSVSTMLNMEGRFARLRDISKEVDEAEGEIAAKDAALKRLKESIVLKDNAFSKEKEALSQLEVEIAKTKLAIQDAQQQQQQQNPPPSDHVMVDEALSAGLSHVFV